MGINRRISSAHARFVRNPQKVRNFLEAYSKKNPASVGQEIFDAIHNTPALHDLRDRVKLNVHDKDEALVLPVRPIANVINKLEATKTFIHGKIAELDKATELAGHQGASYRTLTEISEQRKLYEEILGKLT